MTLSLFVTVVVMFVLSFLVIGYTFYRKNKIPCMTGMMIAMTLGMIVGLTAGVILGIIYAGNLFISTLLGMLIGLVVGFLAGVPVSIMAVLDGMLSGMMGGMMGAMLGEMIALDYRDMMIKIMFVLFVGIILILLYMMQQELSRKKDQSHSSLFHNPIVIIVVMGIFFFGYNQLGPSVSFSKVKQQEEIHQHQNMEMEQSQEQKNTDSNIQNAYIQNAQHNENTKDNIDKQSRIVIQAKEYAFLPEKIQIPAEEEITLVLQNVGNQEHDLEIVGLDANIIGNHNNEEEGTHHVVGDKVHIHTSPGKEKQATFIPLERGVYQMICTLPGHKESGMQGIIEVL